VCTHCTHSCRYVVAIHTAGIAGVHSTKIYYLVLNKPAADCRRMPQNTFTRCVHLLLEYSCSRYKI
jgi:hypothetical protein